MLRTSQITESEREQAAMTKRGSIEVRILLRKHRIRHFVSGATTGLLVHAAFMFAVRISEFALPERVIIWTTTFMVTQTLCALVAWRTLDTHLQEYVDGVKRPAANSIAKSGGLGK